MSWQDIKSQLEYEKEKAEKTLQQMINEAPTTVAVDEQDIAFQEGMVVGLQLALDLIRYYYE